MYYVLLQAYIYYECNRKSSPRKKTTAVQRIQQNPAKPVTRGVSFAAWMVNASNENQKGPLTQTHTQKKKRTIAI